MKRVGTSRYLHRSAIAEVPDARARIAKAAQRHMPTWDVCRLDADGSIMLGKTSSWNKPHPSLRESVLVRPGQAPQRRVYGNSPPIYHRCEEMLGARHPARARHAALTRQESEAGLLGRRDIGTVRSWDLALAKAGFTIRGFTLCAIKGSASRSVNTMTKEEALAILASMVETSTTPSAPQVLKQHSNPDYRLMVHAMPADFEYPPEVWTPYHIEYRAPGGSEFEWMMKYHSRVFAELVFEMLTSEGKSPHSRKDKPGPWSEDIERIQNRVMVAHTSCPYCHAKPGSPCSRPSGHMGGKWVFHAGRRKAFDKYLASRQPHLKSLL